VVCCHLSCNSICWYYVGHSLSYGLWLFLFVVEYFCLALLKLSPNIAKLYFIVEYGKSKPWHESCRCCVYSVLSSGVHCTVAMLITKFSIELPGTSKGKPCISLPIVTYIMKSFSPIFLKACLCHMESEKSTHLLVRLSPVQHLDSLHPGCVVGHCEIAWHCHRELMRWMWNGSRQPANSVIGCPPAFVKLLRNIGVKTSGFLCLGCCNPHPLAWQVMWAERFCPKVFINKCWVWRSILFLFFNAHFVQD